MTQRGRSRNAGDVDSNIAETVPLAIAPMWVSGRFYSGALFNSALGTLALSTTAYLMPCLIPFPLTVTSIGVEITTGGGAGSLERLAIYADDKCRPSTLVLDAGTVVADATGFQSAAISVILKAGVYWLALANKSVTSNPSVRAFQTSTIHAISMATLMAEASTSAGYISLSNNPAVAGIVDTGWMREFITTDLNTQFNNTANSPRILLGV